MYSLVSMLYRDCATHVVLGGRKDMAFVMENLVHSQKHDSSSEQSSTTCTLYENATALLIDLKHNTVLTSQGDAADKTTHISFCADAVLTSKHFLGNTLGNCICIIIIYKCAFMSSDSCAIYVCATVSQAGCITNKCNLLYSVSLNSIGLPFVDTLAICMNRYDIQVFMTITQFCENHDML